MLYPDRYIRQTALQGFGKHSQEKLGASSVLVVGLGGLGIPVIQYLTAMGVRTLGLMDGDMVQIHNLQRQPLFLEGDLGRMKIDCAGEYIARQNSGVHVGFHPVYLNEENALETISKYDLVVDASDNFGTRYLINDACIILDKPFVYGGLYGFEGQLSVFNYKDGPTYRCLFPDSPAEGEIPDCNTRGVLGILPGIIGALQGLEAVKVLCDIGKPLSGTLLLFDGLQTEFRKVRYKKSSNSRITELRGPYNVPCNAIEQVDLHTLKQALHNGAGGIDVRNPDEFDKAHIPGTRNIPLHQLQDRRHEMPEQQLYIICQGGNRSQQAIQLLEKLFPAKDIYNLANGLEGTDPSSLATNKPMNT